jgi:tetratricopeptide (TPR) repeat protein
VERGDWNSAASLFMAARDARPDEAVSHYNLGLCMMQAFQAGVELKGKETIPEAIEHFRRALALRLDYAEAWLALGKALGMAATRPAEDATKATRGLETATLGALFAASALDQGAVRQWALAHLIQLSSYEGAYVRGEYFRVIAGAIESQPHESRGSGEGSVVPGALFAFAVACAACCASATPGGPGFAYDYPAALYGVMKMLDPAVIKILTDKMLEELADTTPPGRDPQATNAPPFPALILLTIWYEERTPARDDSGRLIRALSREVPFLEGLARRTGT